MSHSAIDPVPRTLDYDGTNLILLFGLPRSGTTWVAKILDSHPDVLYRHEPDSLHVLGDVPLFPAEPDWEKYSPALRHYAEQVPRFNDVRTCGKLPLFPKRYLAPGAQLALRTAVLASKAATRLHLNLPVAGARWGSDRADVAVLWKSIESLGRLGALRHAIPRATSIHIVRHPCGYVASVARGQQHQQFSAAGAADADWGIFRLLLETPAARARGLRLEHLRGASAWERLAWRWVLMNEKALADLQMTDRHRVLVYERLCAAPEAESRALLAHCGLDWHQQTAQFVAESTGSHHDTYYGLTKHPHRAAWRWRHELPTDAIRDVLNVVCDSPAWAPYAELDA